MKNKTLTPKDLKRFTKPGGAHPELGYVHVGDWRMTATDSFVLVDVPHLSASWGLWDPKTNTRAPDGLKFPDWKNIVPSDEPKATVYVNGEYLAKVAKLIASQSALNGVTLEIRGAGRPIVIRGKNMNETSLGLVMPMRS